MPKEKDEKSLCMSGLRHAEYYGMQEVFDGLYAKSSKNETFTNLMNIILKRENILLAYRNIKSNDGSKTPGTDGVTFDDIGKLMPDEVIDTVRFITIGSTHGYRPKPVRRKEIPKPYDPTKTRPLGIPCVWDRRAHWGFHVLGTGWYSNVSSRSWSRFVKRNSAKTVMDSVQTGLLKTPSQERSS